MLRVWTKVSSGLGFSIFLAAQLVSREIAEGCLLLIVLGYSYGMFFLQGLRLTPFCLSKIEASPLLRLVLCAEVFVKCWYRPQSLGCPQQAVVTASFHNSV